jgi:hypothetical protein
MLPLQDLGGDLGVVATGIVDPAEEGLTMNDAGMKNSSTVNEYVGKEPTVEELAVKESICSF